MNLTLNFDMDGTIADLYGVENWLEMLINGDETPYAIAKPLINLSLLARLLNRCIAKGIKVNVISWLAKNSNSEYDEKVTNAKIKWLKKHLPSVKFNDINIVAYGTPKSLFSNEWGILFDDEERNRTEWVGTAYNEKNIFTVLKMLA